ncbi:hypothetical protein D1BOALGB6SA_6916 [Olavius sp. associated proteobacterium Delta 1]|nr:hypothetical protein D1BOALGB6SA_6916 [Olavius sp. associated proteobacterium Delta 1]
MSHLNLIDIFIHRNSYTIALCQPSLTSTKREFFVLSLRDLVS